MKISLHIYSLLKNQSLIRTFKILGYVPGDSDTYEMIKKL